MQRLVGDRGGGRWYLGQYVAELVRVCLLSLGDRATAEALAAQAHDGVARNRCADDNDAAALNPLQPLHTVAPNRQPS